MGFRHNWFQYYPPCYNAHRKINRDSAILSDTPVVTAYKRRHAMDLSLIPIFYFFNMNQDRMNSNINKGFGSAKESAGNMMGNKKMESEGQAQRQGGKLQEMEAKAGEMLDDAKQKVEGVFQGMSKSTDQSNR